MTYVAREINGMWHVVQLGIDGGGDIVICSALSEAIARDTAAYLTMARAA